MTESDDVLGPVDYIVVEFPADRANFSGEVAAELISLVERGLVRVLDLVLVRKNDDGSLEAEELAHADESAVGEQLRGDEGIRAAPLNDRECHEEQQARGCGADDPG